MQSSLPDASTDATNEIVIEPPITTHADYASDDADFALQSNDNVLFKLYKAALGLHSGFFRDMFETPQPVEDRIVALQPVRVEESSAVLQFLLKPICRSYIAPHDFEWPTMNPHLALSTLKAADKYYMPLTGYMLSTWCLKDEQRIYDCLSTYTIATRLRLTPLRNFSALIYFKTASQIPIWMAQSDRHDMGIDAFAELAQLYETYEQERTKTHNQWIAVVMGGCNGDYDRHSQTEVAEWKRPFTSLLAKKHVSRQLLIHDAIATMTHMIAIVNRHCGCAHRTGWEFLRVVNGFKFPALRSDGTIALE